MILSIQYLRAIAALLVVVHHSLWKVSVYSADSIGWFHIGSAGIDLFFIISGYIMTYTTYNKEVGFFKFIKARIIRIIPLYWLLTTIALVGFLLIPEKINSSGGVTSILDSYLLFPTDNKYLIQNGWTLSYEFLFYFIFGIGLIFRNLLQKILPVIIIIFLVSIGLLFKYSYNIYINFVTSPYLLEFLLGVILFYILKKISFSKIAAILFIIISILLLIYVNIYINNFESFNRIMCFGIPFFFLFIGIISLETIFEENKSNCILNFFYLIGNSSYSLYLIHPFVLVVVSIILSKCGINNGYLFILILVTMSIVIGYFTFILIESKLLKIFRRKR